MKKETKRRNKEVLIIGIVKEIEVNSKSFRLDIVTTNGRYNVRMNEVGRSLQYEVGNKVEAVGIISRTKTGIPRITVTDYEVYEMADDDPEEFFQG
jgi:hypothetical protein